MTGRDNAKMLVLLARAFGYSVSWVTPNTLSREYAESSVLFYVHISLHKFGTYFLHV